MIIKIFCETVSTVRGFDDVSDGVPVTFKRKNLVSEKIIVGR